MLLISNGAFPYDSTPFHPCARSYHSTWRQRGIWTRLHWALHKLASRAVGRGECLRVAIIDGQSVKTTERGGIRGFDGHKKVKGRKRHIAVDTLGLPFAGRVEPADVSDRVAARQLLGGLRFAFPDLHTIIADAGHESRRLAQHLKRHDGDTLQIVKWRQQAFKIVGLTWIVERSIAWLNRSGR